MDGETTVAEAGLADSSASWNCEAALSLRWNASTASCGLTMAAPGCCRTNMARSSESV